MRIYSTIPPKFARKACRIPPRSKGRFAKRHDAWGGERWPLARVRRNARWRRPKPRVLARNWSGHERRVAILIPPEDALEQATHAARGAPGGRPLAVKTIVWLFSKTATRCCGAFEPRRSARPFSSGTGRNERRRTRRLKQYGRRGAPCATRKQLAPCPRAVA